MTTEAQRTAENQRALRKAEGADSLAEVDLLVLRSARVAAIERAGAARITHGPDSPHTRAAVAGANAIMDELEERARARAPESITDAAARIFETLTNGNRNDAHAELVAMPTARAMAVAARMIEFAEQEPERGMRSSVQRFFEDRAE